MRLLVLGDDQLRTHPSDTSAGCVVSWHFGPSTFLNEDDPLPFVLSLELGQLSQSVIALVAIHRAIGANTATAVVVAIDCVIASDLLPVTQQPSAKPAASLEMAQAAKLAITDLTTLLIVISRKPSALLFLAAGIK